MTLAEIRRLSIGGSVAIAVGLFTLGWQAAKKVGEAVRCVGHTESNRGGAALFDRYSTGWGSDA